MASLVSSTSLSPLSIRGMSHDRLLVKMRELTQDNMKLLEICHKRGCEIKCLQFRLKSVENRLMDSSLHPGIRGIRRQQATPSKYFTFGDVRQ